MMTSSDHFAACPKRAAAGFAQVMSPFIVFQAWKSEGEELPRQPSLTGIVPARLFVYESTG